MENLKAGRILANKRPAMNNGKELVYSLNPQRFPIL
jgi:hypothetical protein